MTAESNPRAAEVYCVRCPTCGVEWAMRWPPPVGRTDAPCGHLTHPAARLLLGRRP